MRFRDLEDKGQTQRCCKYKPDHGSGKLGGDHILFYAALDLPRLSALWLLRWVDTT